MKTETFKLAGVRHYEDNIMSLLRVNGAFDFSDQELKDLYADEKVPEFVPKTDLQVFLEEEPTNQYDPNAVKVLINGVHVGYIKAGSCTHAKNVMAAGIKKIFVEEIAIGRYKYVTEDYVETEDYSNPRIAIVVIYGPEEEAASPDPKVVEEAGTKKAPVKEPRKGMKKRLIILAIIAWIILSALCYLLTPPLVLGIVIFALVYNIFKRLKI